ncbi:MAG: hypothetical protein ABI129_12695 [Rhodanobacter sp.]
MIRLQHVVLLVFVFAVPACVAQSATPAAPAHGASSATQVLPEIKQGIEHNETEVRRLQREVAMQESDSERAGQRLHLQDQQIAELRKKLAQLQSKSVAAQP